MHNLSSGWTNLEADNLRIKMQTFSADLGEYIFQNFSCKLKSKEAEFLFGLTCKLACKCFLYRVSVPENVRQSLSVDVILRI